MDLNICGGAYSLKAPIAVQECINMFPEAEVLGAQARIVLRRFPGLKSFASAGSGSPVRGLKRMANVLYGVLGKSLYRITEAGALTQLGTIDGAGIVSMATDGTNLVIVNGTSTAYVYNGSTLATISDADFVSSDKVLFLDTYFIHLRTDSNQFFLSESGSATSYIATDRATVEAAPEDIVSIATSNRDLIIFQENDTETWRNTGNPDFPFERQGGTYQNRGAAALNSVVSVDNDVYYLGDDRVVYRLSGYQSVRVSHHAIEKWISEQSKADVDAALGMTITHQGHYWYILSFDGGTWAYDITTSAKLGQDEWFQLKSDGQDNWRVDVVETCYGLTLCGGADGVVYQLDQDTLDENGSAQLKRRTTPYYINEHKNISPHRIRLAFEEGVGTASVLDPQVALRISNDGGRTWGNPRQRAMGGPGEYRKDATWARNGSTRLTVYEFSVTDSVDVTFIGAWADLGGSSG